MTKLNRVYKKDVVTEFYVQVGTVNECGYIQFNNPVSKEIKEPNTYYPEFYIELEETKEVKQMSYIDGKLAVIKQLGNYITSTYKKVFIPKNLPQQLISLVGSTLLNPEEYYVTGYVTKEGKAIYYDQFMNEAKE